MGRFASIVPTVSILNPLILLLLSSIAAVSGSVFPSSDQFASSGVLEISNKFDLETRAFDVAFLQPFWLR